MHIIKKLLAVVPLFAHFFAGAQEENFQQSKTFQQMNSTIPQQSAGKTEVATFGAGCYWCTEAQFQQLKGVNESRVRFLRWQCSKPHL